MEKSATAVLFSAFKNQFVCSELTLWYLEKTHKLFETDEVPFDNKVYLEQRQMVLVHVYSRFIVCTINFLLHDDNRVVFSKSCAKVTAWYKRLFVPIGAHYLVMMPFTKSSKWISEQLRNWVPSGHQLLNRQLSATTRRFVTS